MRTHSLPTMSSSTPRGFGRSAAVVLVAAIAAGAAFGLTARGPLATGAHAAPSAGEAARAITLASLMPVWTSSTDADTSVPDARDALAHAAAALADATSPTF